MSNKKIRGAFFTLLGGACWGLSGSMGQYLFTVQGMDSRWLVPIRLGLAGILMLIFALWKLGPDMVMRPWKTKKSAVIMLVYGLAGVSACQFFYFLTIQLSSAGIGTILQDLSPITILLVECLLDRRKPKGLEIISLFFAIGGVFLLTTHGDPGNMAVSGMALLTGVISALCVTVYNVVAERTQPDTPVIIMQGWSFLMGGALFSLLFRPWTYHYVPTAAGYFGIAFVVLVGNVMAFTFYIQGVRYIGAEKGILFGFSEPVTAALITFFLLGSKFTVWDFLGFAAIFIMIVLLSHSTAKEKEVQPMNYGGM